MAAMLKKLWSGRSSGDPEWERVWADAVALVTAGDWDGADEKSRKKLGGVGEQAHKLFSDLSKERAQALQKADEDEKQVLTLHEDINLLHEQAQQQTETEEEHSRLFAAAVQKAQLQNEKIKSLTQSLSEQSQRADDAVEQGVQEKHDRCEAERKMQAICDEKAVIGNENAALAEKCVKTERQMSALDIKLERLRADLSNAEAIIADKEAYIHDLQVGLHVNQFTQRPSFPVLSEVFARVLDNNFRKWQSIVGRPFESTQAAAKHEVEEQTAEHRQPSEDQCMHAGEMQTLDERAGCGLKSVEWLSKVLAESAKEDEQFFAAVKGGEIQAAVDRVLAVHTGPRREEDKYLKPALNKVPQLLDKLYNNHLQAASDNKQRSEKGHSLENEIKVKSEQISKDLVENLVELEDQRNEQIEHLMNFHAGKLKAITSQDRIVEVLDKSQKEFEGENSCKASEYEARVAQHEHHETVQLEKVRLLEECLKKKKGEYQFASAQYQWQRLYCAMQVKEQTPDLHALLIKVQDSVDHVRLSAVERDRARREYEEMKEIVLTSTADQGKLAKEHTDLAQHYRGSLALLADVESAVKCGYAGLKLKSESDAAAVAAGLPSDHAMMKALSAAFKEELDRQIGEKRGANRLTHEALNDITKQLRMREHRKTARGRPFAELSEEKEELQNDLSQQETDLRSLVTLQEKVEDIMANYQKEYNLALPKVSSTSLELVPHDSSHHQIDIRKFLFTGRSTGLSALWAPPRHMLTYDAGAMSWPASIAADDFASTQEDEEVIEVEGEFEAADKDTPLQITMLKP